MLGFILMVLLSEHINMAQASQLCLALLAISFLHIKCNFFRKKIGAYYGLHCFVYMFSESTSWS